MARITENPRFTQQSRNRTTGPVNERTILFRFSLRRSAKFGRSRFVLAGTDGVRPLADTCGGVPRFSGAAPHTRIALPLHRDSVRRLHLMGITSQYVHASQSPPARRFRHASAAAADRARPGRTPARSGAGDGQTGRIPPRVHLAPACACIHDRIPVARQRLVHCGPRTSQPPHGLPICRHLMSTGPKTRASISPCARSARPNHGTTAFDRTNYFQTVRRRRWSALFSWRPTAWPPARAVTKTLDNRADRQTEKRQATTSPSSGPYVCSNRVHPGKSNYSHTPIGSMADPTAPRSSRQSVVRDNYVPQACSCSPATSSSDRAPR